MRTHTGGVLAAVGLMVAGLSLAVAGPEVPGGRGGSHHRKACPAHKSPAAATAATKPVCPHLAAQRERLERLSRLLEGAEKALRADQRKSALDRIAEARRVLAQLQRLLPRPVGREETKGGVLNTRCPMMGLPLEKDLPPNLTRRFKGRKVGFCCAACPAAWDRLTPEQKEAKLKAVLPEKH